MSKLVLKGLAMTIIVFIATTISTSGFPTNAVGWQILGITTVGTIIAYIAQSVAFPSTSVIGDINLKDLLKGGLLTLGNLFSGFSAAQITGTAIDWKALLISAGTILISYFVKQFATFPSTIPKR